MEEKKLSDRERLEALTRNVELLLASVREQAVSVRELISAASQNTRHISRLVGIIENHENRITRIENRPN
jgi:flagellar biosynthesis regulator FlaF